MSMLNSIHLIVIFGYLMDGRAAGYSGPLHQWFCFSCFVSCTSLNFLSP